MARRSLKGHVAACSTGFLRLLSFLVIIASVAPIIMLFVIRPSPTAQGWGLIILSIVTFVSGVVGVCTVKQLGCCGLNIFLSILTAVGLAVASIMIFVKPDSVLADLSPTVPAQQGKQLLLGAGIVFFFLFCTQLLVLLVGCLVEGCGFADYYEDLDGVQAAKDAEREAKEEEKRRSRIESTSAHTLAQKMKEKYGAKSDVEAPAVPVVGRF